MQRYQFDGGSLAHGADSMTTSSRRYLLDKVRRHRVLLLDVAAVVLAVLDVALVVPQGAQTYSLVVSGVACAALVARRRFPALVLTATIPGFFVGWSEIAGMIALGTVAYRYRKSWQTVVGACAVWCCRFVIWPPQTFLGMTWREHAFQAIYAVVVMGMPVAIGLFAAARKDLAARVTELAESRARERALLEDAARADERAKLAREMHDIVSHQVTLIAMQAAALQVATPPARRDPPDGDPGTIAADIRILCTRTLDELRGLVGVLRGQPSESAADGQDGVVGPYPGYELAVTAHRDLHALAKLARDNAVHLRVEPRLWNEELPAAVAAAAYRTVQEALTNARKHAPGSPVAITVQRAGRELRVEVTNGAGTAAELAALPSGGHGLSGLRERAALLGGSLHAEPTITGGFRVRAAFPLPGG